MRPSELLVFRAVRPVRLAAAVGMWGLGCATTSAPVVTAPVAASAITAPVVEAPPPPSADERFAEARQAYDKRDYAAAGELLKDVLNERPDDAEALFFSAAVAESQKKVDEALSLYRRVLQTQPTHEGAVLNLGRLLRFQGKFADAIDLYVKALEASPDNLRWRNNLGVLYRLNKQFPESEKTLRAVLARSPGDVDAYKNMAVLFYDSDRLALAEQFSIEARKLDAKDAGILVNLGLIHYKRDGGKPARAMRLFRDAVQLDDKVIEGHRNMGAIALRYRDYESAVKSYARVVELQPSDPEAHLSYGLALDGAKKNKEAIAEFDEATRLLQKDRPDIVFARGLAALALRDWAGVKESFEKYLTLEGRAADREAKAQEYVKSAGIMLSRPATPAPAPAPAPTPTPTPTPAPSPEPAAAAGDATSEASAASAPSSAVQ